MKKFWIYIKASALLIISLFILLFASSCSKDDDSSSNTENAIINVLKSHKWFNGNTYVDIDSENLYAQIDKDSRWLFFLTDTTAVSIDVASSSGTDGYESKNRTYTYYKYEVREDGQIALQPEGKISAVRYKYTTEKLVGTGNYMDLYPYPLSGDGDFIAKQSKLAQIHLMSESERLDNLGHLDIKLLNCGALDKTQNYFNVSINFETADYMLEREFTKLRLSISSSVTMTTGSKTKTKSYSIADNDKQSHNELCEIHTTSSTVTLHISLSAYDAKSMKRFFLVESKEVAFDTKGNVKTSDTTKEDEDNSSDESQSEVVVFTDDAITEGCSATLNGDVSGLTKSGYAGFIYGTNADLTLSNGSKVYHSISADGLFEETVTGLKCNTTYYYMSYVKVGTVYYYGDIQEFTTYDGMGEADGYTWIDLGLPSGTKWAKYNVQGNSEKYCSYNYWLNYQWGETKSGSTSLTYKFFDYSSGTTYALKYSTNSKYGVGDGLTELEYEDDAAYVHMGTSWCTPTKTQMAEIIDKCSWKYCSKDGRNGYEITGPSGNSIFLPSTDTYTYYWTKTVCLTFGNTGDCTTAYALQFSSSMKRTYSAARFEALLVRAVLRNE